MADAASLHRSLIIPPFAPIRYALRKLASRALRSSMARGDTDPAFAEIQHAVVAAFLRGYEVALDARDAGDAAAQLDTVEPIRRGFAYEGASMALALLDAIVPSRPMRVDGFAATAGKAHLYLVHVGAGWAAARLRRSPERARAGLDPLLGWLAVDGYGFHEGYFRPDRVIRSCVRPRRAAGYAARVFDQGVGRSLWFVDAGHPARVARSIARFPLDRQADLWSGAGLAAAYAGGASADRLRALHAASGVYAPHLAQGAAFAAEARALAGNPAEHTEVACGIFARRTADAAARLVRDLRDEAADGAGCPAYEIWRQRVAAACS